jgi:hypothetical protein
VLARIVPLSRLRDKRSTTRGSSHTAMTLAGGSMGELVPAGFVERSIIEIRETKVILDSDLAALYGVETRRLNEQMKRNRSRFPNDFVFQLSPEECVRLRSQFAISNVGRGGRRSPPFAYTEHGALMAASVLNSQEAIRMSVFIVRAFVRLRSIYSSHIELTRRLDELDTKVGEHDVALRSIVEAIRQLMAPTPRDRRPIGFTEPDSSRSAGRGA